MLYWYYSSNIFSNHKSFGVASALIAHETYGNDSLVISSVLDHLRSMGQTIITQWHNETSEEQLRRIIEILNELSNSKFEAIRETINVPEHLYQLMELSVVEIKQEQIINSSTLIKFLTRHADPKDVIETLRKWILQKNSPSSLNMQTLRKLLERAARNDYNEKSTGALMRLQRARNEQRKRLAIGPKALLNGEKTNSGGINDIHVNFTEISKQNTTIWGKLLQGDGVIDK